MDRPAKTPALVQPSIRSFFQPRQPTYAAPPSTSSSAPPRHRDAGNNNSRRISPIELQPASTKIPATIPQPPPLPPQPRSALRPAASSQSPPPSLSSLSSLPALPPPPSLPQNATIAPITAEHIPALRRINSLLLQITYPDSFYTTILTSPTSSLFSRAILWADSPSTTPKLVGSIVCRLESSPESPASAIYIQSLTLLSPYRSLGLAAAALEHVVSTAALLNLDSAAGLDIETIYAHVWTENDEGLRWYTSRGFKREGKPVTGYYFRLRPDTAWVVSRSIDIMSATPPNGVTQGDGNGVAAEERGRGGVLAGAVNLPGFADSITSGVEENGGSDHKKVLPPRPGAMTTSLSYQKTRPVTEWNDLPADMVAAGNGPPKAMQQHLSAPASGASSRSSSSARRKKDRAYPAAAFGS